MLFIKTHNTIIVISFSKMADINKVRALLDDEDTEGLLALDAATRAFRFQSEHAEKSFGDL